MLKRFLFTILLILLTGLMACASPDPVPSDDILAPLPSAADEGNAAAESDANLPTLLELLSEDPNLVFFFNGLNNIGLADDLQSGGPFTIFAPSNLAFTRSELVVSQMDPAVLGPLLDNHLVEGAYLKPELTAAGSVMTLADVQLPIIETEGQLVVDYALVDGEPIQASNGVLYVINTLLLGPEIGPEKSMWGVLQADGRFTTFLTAIEGTGMMNSLRFGDSVDAILAPTDEAFANMAANVAAFLESDPHALEFVVNYHFLSPDGWSQGADLTLADMVALGEITTHVPIDGSGFGRGFEKIIVTDTGDGVQIGGANVVAGDLDATNGIVHAIDEVLIPQVILEHIE